MMTRTGILFVPGMALAASGLAASAGPFGLNRTPLAQGIAEEYWVQIVDSADVDGDGLLDYLIGTSSVSNQESVFSVAFREADGSLTYSALIDLRSMIDSDVRSSFADTDGDGSPEIIAIGDSDLVRVPFVGRVAGVPALSELEWDPSGPAFEAPVLAVADFAGDGADALAYFDFLGQLRVRWPDGTEQAFEVGLSSPIMGPVGDYNNDGLPDIMAFDTATDTAVMIPGTEQRSFGSTVVTPIFDTGGVIVDLDHDGSLDYVVKGPGSELYWYPSIGQDPGQSANQIDAAGMQLAGVAAGVQLEPDGPVGLVVWVIRQNRIPGAIEAAWWADPLSGDTTHSTLGYPGLSFGSEALYEARDVDGDGRNDLVAYGRVIDVFDARTCALPAHLGASREAIQANTIFTDLVDLNGDGNDEIITVSDNDVTIDAGGSGPDRERQTVSVASGAWMTAVAERNGERVIVGTSTGGVVWVLEENQGIWSEAQRVNIAASTAPRSIVVADLDADGVDEIAVTDSVSQVLIFRFDASGVLGQVGSVPMSDSIALAAADLTGDGLPELIGGDQVNERVVVLKNQGGLAFTPMDPIGIEDWPYWIVAADIDGDGFQDLATGYEQLLVLWGEGDGVFSEPQQLPAPSYMEMNEIVAEDLDGDGMRDIAMSSASTGGTGLSHVFMQLSPRVFDTGTPLPGSRHAGVRAGDVNGDGATDLVTVAGQFRDIHWGNVPDCVADVNGDCAVNFFDVSSYIASFNAQSPSADLAEPFGTLNFFDVSAFISAFNAGCP